MLQDPRVHPAFPLTKIGYRNAANPRAVSATDTTIRESPAPEEIFPNVMNAVDGMAPMPLTRHRAHAAATT